MTHNVDYVWGNDDADGSSVQLLVTANPSTSLPWVSIVAVVGDGEYQAHVNLDLDDAQNLAQIILEKVEASR